MVSKCKRSINAVTVNKLKARARGLSQKAMLWGTKVVSLCHGPARATRTQPANRADLSCCVIQVERGKPVAPPRRGQGSRKANCWGGGHGKVEKAKATL